MASFDSSLLQASQEGNLDKVQHLIEKQGVDVNVQGLMNRSPLHLASLYGKMEVVIYLRDKGAKTDLLASSGETPLHLATINGHANVVEYLLSEGTDWKIVNNSGKKASDYARKKNLKKLFEDAEKGIFNHEEEEVQDDGRVLKKKKALISNKLVEDLIQLGYHKGDILESMYTINEANEDANKISNVVKELERKKDERRKEMEVEHSSKSKDDDGDEENSCKICFENRIDCVIIPCGHISICINCSVGLKLCPMCRQDIVQVIKTFKS